MYSHSYLLYIYCISNSLLRKRQYLVPTSAISSRFNLLTIQQCQCVINRRPAEAYTSTITSITYYALKPWRNFPQWTARIQSKHAPQQCNQLGLIFALGVESLKSLSHRYLRPTLQQMLLLTQAALKRYILWQLSDTLKHRNQMKDHLVR